MTNFFKNLVALSCPKGQFSLKCYKYINFAFFPGLYLNNKINHIKIVKADDIFGEYST